MKKVMTFCPSLVRSILLNEDFKIPMKNDKHNICPTQMLLLLLSM